jgi:hypothetical protein
MSVRWPNYEQKRILWEQVGYAPYPLQEPFHRSEARVIQLVGAEGGGKSFVTAKEILARLPWCKLVYLVGQEFENTRREYEYLRDDLLQLGIADKTMVSDPKNPPWTLATATGCRIVTVSVTKAGASAIIAKGEQPDIIALLEAGIIVGDGVFNASWRRVTRSDGIVLLSGTLKDDYGWYATLEDTLRIHDNDYSGQTFSVPAWANLAIYPGGEDDPQLVKMRKTLPEDEYSRTIAARKMTSLAAIFGGVFDPSVHVRPCPFQNGLPVILAIDPGWYPSSYAICVLQQHGDELWQIDEVYEQFKTHDEMIELCKDRVWWVAVREAYGDVAMEQHQADRSAKEVWQAKANLTVRGQRMRVQDGIDRHRAMLQQRRLYHDPKCVNTIHEYKMYRRRVDREGHPVSDVPLDDFNHAMKALVYAMVGLTGYTDHPNYQPNRRTRDPWATTMRAR